ncbi:MAG: hypothetical protein KIS96_03675 [Bauldia sp.]|nr:hypothetical protein [Bauldia sp.]
MRNPRPPDIGSIEYLVLTEGEGIHHVVIRRDGSEWFQRVATFPLKERAEDYAESENNYLLMDTPEDVWGHQRLEAADAPPETPSPPSAIKPENFRLAEVPRPEPPAPPVAPVIEPLPAPDPVAAALNGARFDDQAERPEDEAGDQDPAPRESAAEDAPSKPKRSLREILEEPVPQERSRPAKKTEGWAKPKPATNWGGDKRDPLLVKNGDAAEPAVIPAGSSADQLADRLAVDLPQLVERGGYALGMTAHDIASLYKVPEPRARDAMVKMFARREGRLDGANGKEQRLVPTDWEEPASSLRDVQRAARGNDEARALAALRSEAGPNDLVQMSLKAISDKAGIPLGSVTVVIADLQKRGAIEVASKGAQGSRTATTYRILNPQGAASP